MKKILPIYVENFVEMKTGIKSEDRIYKIIKSEDRILFFGDISVESEDK